MSEDEPLTEDERKEMLTMAWEFDKLARFHEKRGRGGCFMSDHQIAASYRARADRLQREAYAGDERG